jgi:isopenicillin-N epimerase
MPPSLDDELAWSAWAAHWRLREDTTYFNHGSFGPPPEPVRQARAAWQARLDQQPMDFLVRQLEPAWHDARRRLAVLVGTSPEHLVFATNATAAMNVVAASFSLAPGDEVLLNDHEYGAVRRIWERACRRAGAEGKVISLPQPIEATEQVVEAIFAGASQRTRLVVVSHITSPTAIILPVNAICREARRRGIAVCIDGPHAIAQVDVRLDELDCDYYCASCHKWLSAPFGSGFLYVHPRRQAGLSPPMLSWGVPPPREPSAWWEEFYWSGTSDPSAYLSIPAAIEFLEQVGLEAFRARTHDLAQYARKTLIAMLASIGTGDAATRAADCLVPDRPQWYGSMAHVPLPPGDHQSLQRALWERHGIEVPIISWSGRRFIRVSCHLYNNRRQIDRLVAALAELLRSE